MTRRLAALAIALAALAGAVGASGPVSAHEEVPGVRAVIDAVTPPLPAGVTVQSAISVADQLVAANTTAVDLMVLGDGGEPFLRIGPEGVFGNLRSPAWYRANDPTGTAVPPASATADPAVEPVWGRVAKEPAWGWFDHRLHRSPLTTAPAGAKPGEPLRLEEWTVPMRYGTTAVAVAGHREYVQPAGSAHPRVVRAPDALRVVALAGPVPGVTVYLKDLAAAPVTVLGPDGEPIARLSGSDVEVNEASPTWVFTAGAKGGFTPSGPVGASEPPRWRRVGAGRQVTWLERRAQAEAPGADRAWRVSVLVGGPGGGEQFIEGVTEWVPTASSAPSVPAGGSRRSGGVPWRSVLIILGGVALGTTIGVLRRRRVG